MVGSPSHTLALSHSHIHTFTHNIRCVVVQTADLKPTSDLYADQVCCCCVCALFLCSVWHSWFSMVWAHMGRVLTTANAAARVCCLLCLFNSKRSLMISAKVSWRTLGMVRAVATAVSSAAAVLSRCSVSRVPFPQFSAISPNFPNFRCLRACACRVQLLVVCLRANGVWQVLFHGGLRREPWNRACHLR